MNRVQNSCHDGLRPCTLPLVHYMVSHHNTKDVLDNIESSVAEPGINISLKPKYQSGRRARGIRLTYIAAVPGPPPYLSG